MYITIKFTITTNVTVFVTIKLLLTPARGNLDEFPSIK